MRKYRLLDQTKGDNILFTTNILEIDSTVLLFRYRLNMKKKKKRSHPIG